MAERNITRTPSFPHGKSIKWPKVYRGLRRRGMSKEQAARISNAASNKFRGGRRMPLSATAAKKPIPDDILDKRPELRKGQPDVGDVHVPGPLGPAIKRSRRKRKIKSQLAQRMMKHYGPGPHKSGTPQSIHGSWSRGTSSPQTTRHTFREGGRTVDVETGFEPSEGWAVAQKRYSKTVDTKRGAEFARNQVANYVADNWEVLTAEGNYLGTWLDEDTGLIWLDISQVFPDSEYDAAYDWAKRQGEIAIFNLGTFEEVTIDYADVAKRRVGAR